MCHESFTARFSITLYERAASLATLFRTAQSGEWKKIGSYVIEEGALEFGGEYAGGSDHESHATGSAKEHTD